MLLKDYFPGVALTPTSRWVAGRALLVIERQGDSAKVLRVRGRLQSCSYPGSKSRPGARWLFEAWASEMLNGLYGQSYFEDSIPGLRKLKHGEALRVSVRYEIDSEYSYRSGEWDDEIHFSKARVLRRQPAPRKARYVSKARRRQVLPPKTWTFNTTFGGMIEAARHPEGDCV